MTPIECLKMAERKINLEEIAISIFPKDLESGFQYNSFNNTLQIFIKKAMKEACRQTLELAAENAETKILHINQDYINYGIDSQSILNTINQIE